VEFRVDAAKMQVKPDPKVDAKAQAEIQKNMPGTVLESAKHPEVTFRSTHVEKQDDGPWKVEDTLTLDGDTKPLAIIVKQTGGNCVGQTTILQADFRIKPICVGGGMVRVKNELEIGFPIAARPE